MISQNLYRPLMVFMSGLLLATVTFSAEQEPKKKEEPKKESDVKKDSESPKPIKVEKSNLTAAVTVKGIFESDKTTEMVVRLKSWGAPLQVESVVEHGTAVKMGDTLIRFDTEKLQQALRDVREERELAMLSIRLAEQEIPIMRKQLPIDMELAERDFRQATEDLRKFLDVDKQNMMEGAAFSLKSSEFSLESSREELKQLQKMYRDKDLTEDTEQMILKRYKFGVESSEHFFKSAKLSFDRTMNIEIPRRELNVKTLATKAELNFNKAKEVFPLQMKQKELQLEKLRYEENRAREKLADLEKDLAQMVVKAPSDGVVYHGRYLRGNWTTPMGPQGPSLVRGNAANPNEVLMTVIAPGKLLLRGEVEEKEIGPMKAGQVARITPTVDSTKRLGGRVQKTAIVPSNGRFEVRIELDEQVPGIMPGMTGSARIITSRKENALTVPSSAVNEDTDTDTYYVWVPVKGEKPRKKTVKIGLIVGDKTEILEGLSVGDELLPSKP